MEAKVMENKYVMITGGGGFLSYFYAEALLEEGFNIFLTDVNLKNLKNNSKLLKKNFPNKKILLAKMDVTSEKSIIEFLKTNKKIFFHILINNAAIDYKINNGPNLNFTSIENTNLKTWEKDIKTNLTGAFLAIKHFGKKMLKRKEGNIINIASELSVIAPDHRLYNKKKIINYKPASYSCTKHAIIGLTKYIASTWAKNKVRCNSLSPGGIFKNQKSEFLSKINKLIPLGRMGQPEDLKDSIKFLCSSKNKYMTGHNLIIDGGRTII